MKNVNRRNALGTIGLSVGVLAGVGSFDKTAWAEPDSLSPSEWKYVQMSPEQAAENTYAAMHKNGCMYSVFAGIFETWKAASGSNLTFPLYMMNYGNGGVAGWGTLCGALNAAAAAMGLFVQDKLLYQKLISELFTWYEDTELPVFQPKDAPKIDTSKSESVLCHISISKWCSKSGHEAKSTERGERCIRLAASVTAKTVEILNAALIASIAPKEVSNGKAVNANVMSKMKCITCHNDKN